ncbi:MAG: hypothetical protein WAM42_17020, partial [Candidatus Nitrosopolaris sp.]
YLAENIHRRQATSEVNLLSPRILAYVLAYITSLPIEQSPLVLNRISTEYPSYRISGGIVVRDILVRNPNPAINLDQ